MEPAAAQGAQTHPAAGTTTPPHVARTHASLFTPPPIDGRAGRDMLALAALAFAVYWTGLDFLLRGDAALYSDFVANARFNDISLHIGYYALGFVLDRSLGALLDIPIHEMWVYVNLACGALAMPVVYLLARQLLAGRGNAVACTLIFMFCGRVVMNATTSEVYMAQTLMVLLSFLLYIRQHTWRAAIVGGLALYLSPLSAFAYLFFPMFDYLRSGTIRWRHLATFAAAGIAVYTPYLALLGDELLWGRRGLLAVNELARVRADAAIVNIPKFQLKHYTALLLLAIPAVLAWRRHTPLWLLTAAVALPHLYIVVKLVDEENVFLLNTDFFFALLLTTGWMWLAAALPRWRVGHWAAGAALAAHVGALAAFGQLFDFERHSAYASEMRQIARTRLQDPKAIAIVDWDVSVVLTYFGRPTVAGLVEQDPMYARMLDFTKANQRKRSLDGASAIYVVDAWEPSEFSRLLLSPAGLTALREEWSTRRRAERHFGLRCTPIGDYTHPLYGCTPAHAGGT